MGVGTTLPFVKYMGVVYGAHAVRPMAHPIMMWVHDTIPALDRGEN